MKAKLAHLWFASVLISLCCFAAASFEAYFALAIGNRVGIGHLSDGYTELRGIGWARFIKGISVFHVAINYGEKFPVANVLVSRLADDVIRVGKYRWLVTRWNYSSEPLSPSKSDAFCLRFAHGNTSEPLRFYSWSLPIIFQVKLYFEMATMWARWRNAKRGCIASGSLKHDRTLIQPKVLSTVLQSLAGGLSSTCCSVRRFCQFGILPLEFVESSGSYDVLPNNGSARPASNQDSDTTKNERPKLKAGKWFAFPLLLIVTGSGGVFWGLFFSYANRCDLGWRLALGLTGLLGGFLAFLWGLNLIFAHEFNVSQKYLLTSPNYCNTLIARGDEAMANALSTDKQVAVISALAEGSGIRQIERITGVHRDTIMRLGVRVGKGCANVLDAKMRNLYCNHLQFDEVWGFIGKKERHCTPDDSPEMGDVWTFCAIDQDTKIVPSFKVGKRDAATANAFVADVASRLRNRVQISSDALRAYVDAIEMAFGANVDFAQIVKTYVHEESQTAERKYSAPEFVIEEKKSVAGFPDMRLASTSHIERLNGTTRLHMRRLTRLTYAFSKKRENFEAAVALHFAYYNFVKRHNTLRCTPAMAAGIERNFWSVRDLVEAAA
jgi:IS1 family transposase